MHDLVAIAAQNTLLAGVLAILVYGLTRIWRRPPVAHILWLLVLAKLIGPPLLPIDWVKRVASRPIADLQFVARGPAASFSAASAAPAGSLHRPERVGNPIGIGETNAEPIVASADEPAAPSAAAELYDLSRDYFRRHLVELLEGVLFAWMGGMLICGSVCADRVIRFDRKLQGTLRAPQRLQAIAAELAHKLELNRVPDVRLSDACRVPLLWCFGRRVIVVLPTGLIHELDERQSSMILAHELAHLRRRDHWSRSLEIVISIVYWWNPLVWWVRRQLHQVEDLCCDAWVEWIYPDSKKCYAEVLFKAAARLGGTRGTPSLACSFLNAATLKDRIEAVLEGRLSRRVSRKTAIVMAGVAVVLLPAFVQFGNASSTTSGSSTADVTAGPATRGKIVGTVTVDGTGEPVEGATIAATLGTIAKREYASVAARTDANGHYSIDVPIGNAALWPWTFRLPPGYWSTERATNLVTSASAPVATKDYTLRRGAVWQIRVRDAASRERLPEIQCTARTMEGTPAMAVAFTNSAGIASATLPGFHGRFQLVVFDVNHRGRFELASVVLTIDSGFHVDRVAHVTADRRAGTFQFTDRQGKTATLRGAPVELEGGKPVIEVNLVPTATEGTGVVRGMIVDESGRPLAGARVETAQTNGDGTGFITGMAATTEDDGRFEIANAGIRLGGKVSLVVTRAGYGGTETSAQSIPEHPGTPIDFGRIVLLPGKSIRVRILDPAGKPAVGALVEPRGGYAEIIQSGTTDEHGECLIRDLPSGVAKIYATYGELYGNGAALAADEPTTITLHLKPIPRRGAGNPTSQPRPLDLGTPAPELAVAGWIDGKARSLAQYRGKVVVVDFWGIWCGPCVRQLPMRKNLEAKYRDHDVVFLTIHTAGTEMEPIRDFERQMKFDFATALDAGDDASEGVTAKRYSVRGFPTTFIIGRDGRIAWSTDQISTEDRLQNMKRAARSLSIAWPIDQKQPQEKLTAQLNRIREVLLSEAIDHVLAMR
jgi:beta-lactamase regulating signal transducer with metallopeptidase domain/thiol-disulfide isomerase/thioredoxin